MIGFRYMHTYTMLIVSNHLKLQSLTFFVFKMYIISEYTMNPFSTPCFCPESLRYTYNTCLYWDYFRPVQVGAAA